ncbi:MAG TPA: DUF3325 domain-containing protein [Gammaproteobacteria bacterium]|nr:hypothetical protein [Gammaproteobacteria bacterium]HBF09177.1 DUF3325 domain-containing protein [Gammaproteobacteria bacterium]HCK92627.1 DUF3325 domain-containing protein [Gammaproteobacteria bacterium]|tara:strand:- start:890 stop:1219 length:330 start_codon:yes stop_codon:yes gene_type:complete
MNDMQSLWLIIAFVAAFKGMAWFALSLPAHAKQVFGTALSQPIWSRIFGCIGVCISLIACTMADHILMAVLVWFMLLSATALLVAMLLSYKPQAIRLICPKSLCGFSGG